MKVELNIFTRLSSMLAFVKISLENSKVSGLFFRLTARKAEERRCPGKQKAAGRLRTCGRVSQKTERG
jgi:hypothetical protein